MFNTQKPAAQPRSLRTIAETKNGSGGFMDPAPLPELDAVYRDDALVCLPTSAGPRPLNAADKHPFSVQGK